MNESERNGLMEACGVADSECELVGVVAASGGLSGVCGTRPEIAVSILGSGPRGMSAYEVAVKNGFVGTEAEWLASLQSESYLVYQTHFEFPAVPAQELENSLFIAETEHKIYRWIKDEFRYAVFASDYNEIKTIDGGNANE